MNDTTNERRGEGMKKINHTGFISWYRSKRLNQETLAKLINVTGSAISYRTANNIPLDISWLMKWADVYGLTDEQLFNFAFGREFKSSENEIFVISKSALKELLEKEVSA